METEKYTKQRQAEFLLTSAASMSDYIDAIVMVTRAGLNPAEIEHHSEFREEYEKQQVERAKAMDELVAESQRLGLY